MAAAVFEAGSVSTHLLPLNGFLIQIEETVNQLFFQREQHLAQEKLHAIVQEARVADQAEISALQRHLHQTADWLKNSKAGHLGCKVLLEEGQVENDSLKANLRSANRGSCRSHAPFSCAAKNQPCT